MTEKVLLITGASSGIGAASARLAAEAGWRVGLLARSAERVEALAEEIGDAALALPGDATDLASLRRAAEALAARFGGLDAAFANAGMGIQAPGTEAGDPEEWRRVVDVNVMGVLLTAHATLPLLRERRGHFLVTGSAAGRRHIKGSVYGATKWFVHGYAGNLAEEMAEWGGRCTVIAPGMVDTAFFDEPKPQALRPEEVARAVVFALDQPEGAAVREVFVMPAPSG